MRMWGGGDLSPTNSDGAADGVVEAAHVVHLAALCGVMLARGGEEAEVVGSARDVHRAGEGQRLPCGSEVGALGRTTTYKRMCENH